MQLQSLAMLNLLMFALVVSLWTLTPIIVVCTFFEEPVKRYLERRRRVAHLVREAKQEAKSSEKEEFHNA